MSQVAIVTGANQGLGFALVEALCNKLGRHAFVYLTARDPDRGEEAYRALRERGLVPMLHPLDVSEDESVSSFAATIRERHRGVDIVISNAARRIMPDLPAAEQVANFVRTNNHGTHRMLREFAPLLRDGGRFVVVASSFGSLRHLPPNLHAGFDVTRRSLAEIERLMDDYIALVETDSARDAGWPEWINVPSKIGQVAAMKIVAREMRESARRRDILINAVCPGLVDTAASRPWFADMSAAQTPADAAVDVTWLATLPAGAEAPYGELVRHRKILAWQ